MPPLGFVKSAMTALHGPVYASRLRALVRAILPHLERGDRVLDVGCGVGTLGRALMDHPACPRGVVVRGLERTVRGGEPIEVLAYDGGRFPLDDDAADVVIVADVLHHEPDPDALMAECCRVARRLVVLKDHQIAGVLATPRVRLMDWAANAPYGVPCLFRYPTPAGWRAFQRRHGLRPRLEVDGMRLYPPLVEQVFGGRLHYFAVLEPPADGEGGR